jgi:hypothetical protein
MSVGTRSAFPVRAIPGVVRFALGGFVVPIGLAWLCVTVAFDRFGPGSRRTPIDEPAGYGPVKLKVQLPATLGGIPEPLFVCGRPGQAALVYIRRLKDARAKVGVEFWGLGAHESDAFALPAADAVIEVSCYLPVFFPPPGDPYWGNLSGALQALRRSSFLIAVNGVARLKGAVTYDQPRRAPRLNA